MKTTVHIDTRGQEGRDFVEYLRTLSDIVSFEESDNKISSSSYVPIEEFRVEAKKRAKEFLNKQI